MLNQCLCLLLDYTHWAGASELSIIHSSTIKALSNLKIGCFAAGVLWQTFHSPSPVPSCTMSVRALEPLRIPPYVHSTGASTQCLNFLIPVTSVRSHLCPQIAWHYRVTEILRLMRGALEVDKGARRPFRAVLQLIDIHIHSNHDGEARRAADALMPGKRPTVHSQ